MRGGGSSPIVTLIGHKVASALTLDTPKSNKKRMRGGGFEPPDPLRDRISHLRL